MEVEDRESTDSGSLSGNPDSDSPPLSGGDYVVHGGVGGAAAATGVGMPPEVVSMGIAMEKSAAAAVEVGVGGGGVVIDAGGAAVLGGGGRGGGGNGDLGMGKKKRGRPRKYDADGNLNPAYIRSPTAMQAAAGFTLSTPRSYENSSGSKRGRGKHSSASGNWQILASLGEFVSQSSASCTVATFIFIFIFIFLPLFSANFHKDLNFSAVILSQS